ncbi:hypothetical protein C0993_002710, partial [Termitomyces sp. T159_Od127]
RHARDHGGEISYEAVTELFKKSYGFQIDTTLSKIVLASHKLEQLSEGRRQITGGFVVSGELKNVTGVGNGPLSSVLAALHTLIDGSLSIREYSEHSIGEGTDVVAASYVELVYEVAGAKKRSSWGVATDVDITTSGINAVLSAVNSLDVVLKN